MTFLALIFKNLFRQRVRTALTILGISIGITTVITLGVITEGMKTTMGEMMQAGGSDFMIGQKGSSDFTFSAVTNEEWQAVAARDDVLWAHGVLMHIARVGDNPFFVLNGILPDQLAEGPPTILSGTLLTDADADELILGEGAARELGLHTGDTLTIDDRDFAIVGTYRTGMTLQDNGAYAPLAVFREVASKPAVVTGIYV
jgi:putative ABC transport system permease protein